MYVGLRGGRRRSFGASSSKITATCRRLTALKSSENLTTMVKQCRELFCPSARKSQPADRPRKDLNHPLIRRNIAGAVGISSLSWPCMYLGFLAMYRGMKSIKPYNSKILFPAHLSECTCWCQSRVKPKPSSPSRPHGCRSSSYRRIRRPTIRLRSSGRRSNSKIRPCTTSRRLRR